ncbi:hypothetical protein GCM10023144_42930 [Pigmentiphaga soli]|uniref:EAL domain-containing protein n=1 Tax=Pigmentiphaga soli TaxID=1007095 RepID=A0ABP8HNC7_9BURK
MAYPAIQRLIETLAVQPGAHGALKLGADGMVVGRFRQFEVGSHFQPVVRLDTGAAAGHDAYARPQAAGGAAVSPLMLFSQVADDADVVQLDRLCRLVHTVNYFSRPGAEGPLLLRVHGRLLAAITQDHGTAFGRMVEALGVQPASIVLQLPAETSRDVLPAGIVIGNYRRAGFKVGVNPGSADEARSLIRLHAPDVVKLDLRTLAEPERHVPDLLALAHRSSVQVIFKCLEDPAALAALRGWGAEFAQGR